MTQETTTKLNIGQGILKPGTSPIKVIVDDAGEYWLCDSNVDPNSRDFREQGCVAHSEIHMAEGG
jgi:hypothetical protein